MDPKERKMLEETYRLSKENNKILRGIRSSNRWNSFRRALYWLILLAIGIIGYMYLKPYLEQLQATYNAIQGGVEDFNDARSSVFDFFQKDTEAEQ